MKNYIKQILLVLSCVGISSCATTENGGNGGNGGGRDNGGSPGKNIIARMTVLRHVSAPSLSNSEARKILKEASEVVQKSDYSFDFPANIEFVLDGSVRAFSTGDGIIDSDQEHEQLRRSLSGYGENVVALVRKINYCGGPGDALGCAAQGNFFIVIRDNLKEGLVWAHEFGHNAGRRHNPNTPYLMYGQYGARHTALNQIESDAYIKHSSRNLSLSSKNRYMTNKSRNRKARVQNLLRQKFYEGIKMKDIKRYGLNTNDVDYLHEMLNKKKFKESWQNVVGVLGYLGSHRSVNPLVKFFEKGKGTLSNKEYFAKEAVLSSLGMIVNKNKSYKYLPQILTAQSYLFNRASTNKASNMPFKWKSRLLNLKSSYDNRIQKAALQGISYIGTTEALIFLNKIEKQINAGYLNLPINFINQCRRNCFLLKKHPLSSILK